MLDLLLVTAAALLLFRFSGDKAKAILSSMVLSAFFVLLLVYLWSVFTRFPHRLHTIDFIAIGVAFVIFDRMNRISKKKRRNIEDALALMYGFSSANDLHENADEITKQAFSAACMDDPRQTLEAAGLDVSWIENGGDPHIALEEAKKLRSSGLSLASGWPPQEPSPGLKGEPL
jgi:FlaA1/EpsC-like NDP-sugar epimerase